MSHFTKAVWHPSEALFRGIGSRLWRWYVAYIEWRLESLAVEHLTRMSDRDLKDIGLLRSQIEPAVRRAARHPALRWRLY